MSRDQKESGVLNNNILSEIFVVESSVMAVACVVYALFVTCLTNSLRVDSKHMALGFSFGNLKLWEDD